MMSRRARPRSLRAVACVAVAVTLAAPALASAALGSWTTVALPGTPGAIQSIAVDPTSPSIVYAGTEAGGVLKSTDGGATWAPAAAGLGPGVANVQALLIDPTNPQAVLAGTLNDSVYRSSNGGASWSPASVKTPDPDVSGLAFQPGSSRVFAATGLGVAASTDGGASWADTSAGLTEPDVKVVEVSRADPGVVYAGAFPVAPFDRGVFRSVAGGVWAPVGGLGGSAVFPQRVSALAIRPGTPERIYAGGPRLLLGSADQGATWPIQMTAPATVIGIVPDPGQSFLYVAGLGSGISRIYEPQPGSSATAFPDRPLTDGLGDLNVTTLSTDQGVRTLYAGTASGGVARLTVPTADLSLAIEGVPTASGVPAYYRARVANRGPEPVGGVVVAGSLGLTRSTRRVTPSQGTCGIGTCDLGRIEAGASATIEIARTAAAANVALGPPPSLEVTGVARDPDGANNAATGGVVPPPLPPPPPVVISVAAPRASLVRAGCTRPRRAPRTARCTVRISFRLDALSAVRISVFPEKSPKRVLQITHLGRRGPNTAVVPPTLRRRLAPGRYLVTVRPVAPGSARAAAPLTIPGR